MKTQTKQQITVVEINEEALFNNAKVKRISDGKILKCKPYELIKRLISIGKDTTNMISVEVVMMNKTRYQLIA